MSVPIQLQTTVEAIPVNVTGVLGFLGTDSGPCFLHHYVVSFGEMTFGDMERLTAKLRTPLNIPNVSTAYELPALDGYHVHYICGAPGADIGFDSPETALSWTAEHMARDIIGKLGGIGAAGYSITFIVERR